MNLTHRWFVVQGRRLFGWALLFAALIVLLVPVFMGMLMVQSATDPTYRPWVLVYLGVFVICVCLGPALAYGGRRLRILNAADRMLVDRRAPILYLRPFLFDDLSFMDASPQAAAGGMLRQVLQFVSIGSLLRLLFSPGRATELVLDRIRPGTIEQLLAPVLDHAGPVIAVRREGSDPWRMYAAPLFATDGNWQEVVLEAVKASRLIFVMAADIANLRWEMDRVVEHVAPSRIVVMLPAAVTKTGVEVHFRELQHLSAVSTGPFARLSDALIAQFGIPSELSDMPSLMRRVQWRAPLFAYFDAEGSPRFVVPPKRLLGLLLTGRSHPLSTGLLLTLVRMKAISWLTVLRKRKAVMAIAALCVLVLVVLVILTF